MRRERKKNSVRTLSLSALYPFCSWNKKKIPSGYDFRGYVFPRVCFFFILGPTPQRSDLFIVSQTHYAYSPPSNRVCATIASTMIMYFYHIFLAFLTSFIFMFSTALHFTIIFSFYIFVKFSFSQITTYQYHYKLLFINTIYFISLHNIHYQIMYSQRK